MNILTDRLPDCISVNGTAFEIDPDYRKWIIVGDLLRKTRDDSEAEELLKLLCDLVVVAYPSEYILGQDFLEAIVKFYGGPEKPGGRKEKQTDGKRPDFDFILDADYIYQSFASRYGVRLSSATMHWWEFLTLFDGLLLTEDSSINFVVGTRQTQMSKVPKNDRARMTKLKKAFALPKSDQDQKELVKFNDALDKLEREAAGESDHE